MWNLVSVLCPVLCCHLFSFSNRYGWVALCCGKEPMTLYKKWQIQFYGVICLSLADPCSVHFVRRFPTLSPLKSFPTRPLLKDSSDLPRLIRWDDYEELPQRENIAPQKSAVMVSTRKQCCSSSCWLCLTHAALEELRHCTNWIKGREQDVISWRKSIFIFFVSMFHVGSGFNPKYYKSPETERMISSPALPLKILPLNVLLSV